MLWVVTARVYQASQNHCGSTSEEVIYEPSYSQKQTARNQSSHLRVHDMTDQYMRH